MDVTKRWMGYNQALNLEEVIEGAIANYSCNRATRLLQPQDDSYPGQGYSFERSQVEEDNEVGVRSLPECLMPECGGFCHLYFPASASIGETRQPEGSLEAREDDGEGDTPRPLRETLRSEPSSSGLNQLNVDSAYSSLHGSQNMDYDEKGEDKEVDVDEMRRRRRRRRGRKRAARRR